MERNFLIKLAYDGAAYHGWQIQENALTVQQVFQEALGKITGLSEDIKACSRTDTGVHARQFCVSLKTESPIAPERLLAALNHYLPQDVAVRSVEQVPLDFHARYSCKGKEYVYQIWNHPVRDPFLKDRALHYWYPIDEALLDRAAGLTAPEVSDFQALPGNGLTAVLEGRTLWGGSAAFTEKRAAVSPDLQARTEELSRQGKTPLFFGAEDRLLGVIAVADVIKEDSPQAVRELRNMGIHVVMLTGDNQRTAQAIGAQAGVDQVIAGVLPEGKEAAIRRLMQRGKVAMVGDGINDAPALTRADTGIAIGAGADVAIDAADVVLMNSSLLDVPAAIRLSRATLRNIHENLFWAFFYNAIGIPLAAGVFIPLGLTLNPMFGAAAMSLSSFCVVSNALRLNLFKLRDNRHDHKRTNHLNDIKEEQAMEKTLEIKGMMCPHCEATVRTALEAMPQVQAAQVSHESGTAVVTLTAPVEDDTLRRTVEDKGYTVTAIR